MSSSCPAGVEVLHPADRFVRQPERGEDVVVEAVLAQQQLVDATEELARFGALDDPVVVGGGQRDDLADAQLAERLLAGALELGRVLQCADADDGALPGHQPGHGVVGADPAGVGQRDGCSRIVFGR